MGDISNGNLPQKPVRPLTCYHLFFQLEREYILQQYESAATKDEQRGEEDSRPLGKDIDEEMPDRYRLIRLSPHWYASASGKRVGNKKLRKHRKTHGLITFVDLSKRIAAHWRTLGETDKETKLYVQQIAARELEAVSLLCHLDIAKIGM